jgi:hypothetical protein
MFDVIQALILRHPAEILRDRESVHMAATTTTTSTEPDDLRLENTESTPVEAASRESSTACKCLLVSVGFMMMFQVVGINSSHGVSRRATRRMNRSSRPIHPKRQFPLSER